MSTATVDYDALAKQAGALSAGSSTSQQGSVDYAALAKQAGAVNSEAPGSNQNSKQSFWDSVKSVLAPRDPMSMPGAQRPSGAMPGSFEGHPENVGEYVPATAGQAYSGAKDMLQGNIAKGGTQMLSAVSNAMLPAAPFVAAAAPVATAANAAIGYGAGKVAKGAAALLGANPEQQEFSEALGSYALPMAGTALLNRVGPGAARVLNNAVVRPAAKDFQFGKNPSGALAQEGIVAGSREGALQQVTAKKQELGQQIGDALKNSGAGNTIDVAQAVEDPIDTAIRKAVMQGDQGLVDQLTAVKQRWTHTFSQDAQGNVVPTARLQSLSPAAAHDLKLRIGNDTNWSPLTNPYADALNKLQVKVYGNLNDAIGSAVPGVRSLQGRYANLLTAQKGLQRASLNEMRAPAPSGMSIMTSPITTPLGTVGATTLAAGAVRNTAPLTTPLVPRVGLLGNQENNQQ
ncbi:MAG: hypothetical protein JWQ87_2657 [Candidatus Sulfotelmatobacter sp.]|nr:hypothetical protein [Candidatus Sulfotelmatobacter sp.]